eukprot:Skav222863  [mRNA]  locus=scaffold2201:246431:248035:- [translate_table: standard]
MLPIKRSEMKVAGEKVQFLKMSSWAKYLLDRNLWHRLAGLKEPDDDRCSSIWSTFWERYRAMCPHHDVFQRSKDDLARTCALVLHGDEGRSAKKAPILVVSTHSVLGYGLRSAGAKHHSDEYNLMKLNYTLSTWTTRYLLGVLPRTMYADDDGDNIDAFQDFLNGISLDLKLLYDEGVKDRKGVVHYFCVISTMGDWPWIQKAGCLSRSFYNAAKRASSTAPGKGICHLCCADQPGFPWEDWESETPGWVSTINTTSPFWRRPSLLMLAMDGDDDLGASFFTYDLFHTWHLGCGRSFIASAIVVLATSNLFEGSQEFRISTMSSLFQAWCQQTRQRPHMKKITRPKLSWLSNSDYPQGAWGKGSDTTLLIKWFVSECRGRANLIANSDDQLLKVTIDAAVAANTFLQKLYREEVWIDANTASRIADLGLEFLRKHGDAIYLAHTQSRNLFLQMPNLHRYHHITLEMKWRSRQAPYLLSPLALSSQPDEDYMGRPSRISRRVHARSVVLRTLERSLEKIHAQYVKSGLIILDRAR